MYQPYRGQRSQHRRIVRNVVIFLLCLFIAACAVFLLFFQGSFQQWKEDYLKAHPQTTQQTTKKQTTKQSAAKTQQKSSSAATAVTVSKTIELPQSKLGDTAYLQQVIALYQQKKISGAAIVMKNDAGEVTYPSTISALQNTAVLGNTDANVLTAFKTLKAAGLHMTAVLYTYQDNLYPRQNSEALLRSKTGKAWIHSTKRCMDPGSDAAFAYIRSLVQECGSLGFNEVELKAFGWPDTGSLRKIDYGENGSDTARAATLAKQVSELAAAVPAVQISVYLDDPLADGGQSTSGQNLAQLYAKAAQVYVPVTGGTASAGDTLRTKLSSQTGGATDKLVPVYTDTSSAQAVLGGGKAVCFDLSDSDGTLAALSAQS